MQAFGSGIRGVFGEGKVCVSLEWRFELRAS
jgi:hypothetical protein